MQSFEFIDLILFFGISQGVFLAVTIQMIKNKNRSANKTLSVILLLSVLMLLGRMVFFKYMTVTLFRLTIVIDAIIFVFGPLCHIYFRRLIFSKNDHFKLPWYHYLPVIAHLIFAFYFVFISQEDFIKKYNSGYLNIPFLIIEVGGVVSNFIYWLANMKLLRMYIEEEKNRVSYKQGLVSFLKFFQISIGVFIFFWIISFVSSNFFDYRVKFVNYNSVWATISIFIFIVGYYSLKEPEIFRISLQKEKPNQQKRLQEDQISSLEKELQQAIEEEKMFLKPNLTLRDLSERLNTSTHNISWYLNTVQGCNFYDYINHYRIKEFLQKVENNEHLDHTILAISMDVGFNSKSTFNKAFKLEMNDTPSNFIKQLPVA
ncbi:helix-turn-helix domain-containing protein [Aquimarina gracilis]|uniref:Helix-turn-helix domain-containing protein n=1 Tax=Aquimarina gracilis TaxID=874422 RepID=A0ABU5ZZN4_9FLAO|nr:helix-turn-helix domain-containing protein [Aquimarina gracilis]MEB3347348.1 helix-turn-helix domain-containing protein [Aquimarina gracilis]